MANLKTTSPDYDRKKKDLMARRAKIMKDVVATISRLQREARVSRNTDRMLLMARHIESELEKLVEPV